MKVEKRDGVTILSTDFRLDAVNAPKLKNLEINGIYNVGWLSFRRDINGLACLQWWRERCIEWCYDRIENGKFADQKYLDDWINRFPNVVVLKHKGANLALWNLGNYHLSHQAGNSLVVDGQPLIFFHFHGLKEITSWWYDPRGRNYAQALSPILRRYIYAPYIKLLLNLRRQLFLSDIRSFSGLKRGASHRSEGLFVLILFMAQQFKRLFSICKNILTGEYIFTIQRGQK